MLWALGLAPVAAAGEWAFFRWFDKRHEDEPMAARLTSQAAILAYSAHPQVDERLADAFSSMPGYAPARLVSACLNLERGRWERARHDASREALRETPEGRLIQEIALRRPQSPDWNRAFLDAWNTIGRPDFRESTLLPAPIERHFILDHIHLARKRADEAQQFLLAVLNIGPEPPEPEWLVPRLRTSESVPLLFALREQLLLPTIAAAFRQQVLPVVEERLDQLAGPDPRTLQLALRALLLKHPASEPFNHGTLELLEKLLPITTWAATANEAFFLEVRQHFKGLLISPGHHAWFVTSWAQGVSLGWSLLSRAADSKEYLTEDDRRWMGRLLFDLGACLRKQPSDTEMTVGLKLQLLGSELTGHDPTRMDAIGLWLGLGQWEDAFEMSGFTRWPLASMQEEACEQRARDEIGWMKAFMNR